MPVGEPSRKPEVVIVAGPNGSGKTTLVAALRKNSYVRGDWINPDEIAQSDFNGWNDPESTVKAADKAKILRELAVEERKDFTFETVLSRPDKLEFLLKAKDSGYFIRAFYISTSDPSINAARILKRLDKGGHDVELGKVRSRYFRSMANLRKLIELSDITQVFDNSQNGHGFRHAVTFVEGHLHKSRLDKLEMPEWCSDAINDVSRSKGKQQF